MTIIDDYRAFLKAKLKSGQSILNDAENRRSGGEITKANYISMWRREITSIERQLAVEAENPELFGEEASIWERRMKFPLH